MASQPWKICWSTPVKVLNLPEIDDFVFRVKFSFGGCREDHLPETLKCGYGTSNGHLKFRISVWNTWLHISINILFDPSQWVWLMMTHSLFLNIVLNNVFHNSNREFFLYCPLKIQFQRYHCAAPCSHSAFQALCV